MTIIKSKIRRSSIIAICSFSSQVLLIRLFNYNYLKINNNFVVEDNDNCKRHEVLDSAGEQRVPDSVLGLE